MSTAEKLALDDRKRTADRLLADLTRRGWDVLLTGDLTGNLWRVQVNRRIGEMGIATLMPYGRLIEGDYLAVMEVAGNLVNTFEQSICATSRKAARA